MATAEIGRPTGLTSARGQLQGRPSDGAETLPSVSHNVRRWLPRGWLFPISVSLVLASLVEAAYLLAERNVAGQGIFTGQAWAAHDVAQYVAAMNDGGAGAILVKDRLTSEPHAPALIYLFYVLLGWVSHALGIESATGYRLAAVVGRVFVILSLFGATSLVSPATWRRHVAFVLMIFGGGVYSLVGPLQLLLVQFVGPSQLPITGRDLEEPEFGTYLLLHASPHLMFGMGLLVLAALTYARAWRSRHWHSALLAAGLTVALSLVNSYSLGTLCAVVSIHMAVMTVLTRRIVWRGIAAATLVNLAAAPVMLYGVLTFMLGTDPFWGVAYGRQNITLTPSLLNVVVAFGLVLVLAVAAAPVFARRATSGRVLVLTWIIVAAVLMYLPVSVQRRFAFGLQPMLAMVAAFGLPPLWRFVSARRTLPWSLARPFAMLLLLQALVGSTMLMAAIVFSWATDAGTPRAEAIRTDFFPISLQPAGQWLAQHVSPDDVVLAQPRTGNYLVQAMPGRVYVGHWSATVEYLRKCDEVDWLFAESMDRARLAFLVDQRVRYVVAGPIEGVSTDWMQAATAAPGLSLVYQADGVSIFEVTRP